MTGKPVSIGEVICGMGRVGLGGEGREGGKGTRAGLGYECLTRKLFDDPPDQE